MDQVAQGASKLIDLTGGSNAETSANVDSNVQVKVKKFKSEIWNHFDQIFAKPNDKKFHHSCCKYCDGVYGCNTSTATLWGHLDRCLAYPYNKMHKKQKTLESFKTEDGDSKLVSWKFDQAECRKALARMIVIDELPFSFIEREGFRHFCAVAVPRLQLVSRVTIAKDCLRIYADLKKDLKNALSFHANRVCLTTDTWTSLQNMSYMVLTAHFIDHNWKLHKRILNFSLISSHKGVAIGNAIESCMLDWGINKVFTMTVDNASSNDTAISHMKKKLTKKNVFVLDGEFFHIRCCAHILNLIVRDGMEEEEGSIGRIRSAVKYIRGSPQRVERFKNCCELDQIPFKNNLVLDVATRWNYTYLMLDTALKFQKAFERLEEVDPHYLIELEDDVPRDVDWKNAKIFCKFLRTFYEVTKRLSGSHYVTSNYYFHDVMLIQSTIRSWSCSLDECLKSMALRMDAKFKKYWGDLNKMNMMLFFAVVLDPCYKLKYVAHCYKKLYDEDETKKLEAKIKEALSRLYTYYASLDPSFQRSEVGDTSVNNYMEDSQGESMVDDEYVISFESDFLNEEEDTRFSKTELEIYLDEVCIKKVVGTPFDVLEWWKVNSSRFRVLSMMARDVLAIPVTTVASESAFSTGGRILDQFRSSLSPKVAESLICAQDWLRASPIPIELEARMDELADLESCITEDPDLANAFTSPLG